MPPRIARSNVHATAPKTARNKNRKRNLDAYSIASHSAKDKRKVPQHRLGEFLDDEPRLKRRKVGDDEGEDDDDDAEEDRSPKVSRRQRRPDDDGDIEQGSDSSGNEWTLGGLGEDDDDSDLDSDEAFGESDEERFGGFTFRGSSKGVKKLAKNAMRKPGDNEEVDLSEGETEEEEEEDFGEDGVDLATMLDDNDDDETHEQETGEDSDGEEIETSSSDDSDDEDDVDGGVMDEERLARMRDRLESMDEGLRSLGQPENDEAGVISVDDLLADLDPAAKSQFQAALKTKKKSAVPVTLTAPLPKRQQDKINRESATAKAKEQLDRWRDTVMHNRRAEFLNFPLKDPNATQPLGKEKFVPAAPKTELEQNIQRIMEESGMSAKSDPAVHDDAEATLLKAEDLATNKLPVEEVERRRAELRRARELLFREEIKAKRIAKIKSKSYRRVHRKEREREAQKEREAAEAAGVPMDENEADKVDRKRAEERMSTKHRESKWAKSLKATNRTVWDAGARDSVYDQARRNEELKRRIAGKEVDDGDSSYEEDDEEDDHSDTKNIRQIGRLSEREDGQPDKGLASMKFMRKADAKRRAQNDEDVARIRKDLAIEDGDEDSNSEIDDQSLGRAIFGPKSKERREILPTISRSELDEPENSEEKTELRKQAERGITESSATVTSRKPGTKSNLKRSSAVSVPVARESRTSMLEGDNSWLNGAVDKLSKKDKARRRNIGEGDMITVDIDTETPKVSTKKSKMVNGVATTGNGSTAPSTDGWQTVLFSHHHSDDDNSDGNAMTVSTGPKASFQSRAFAGDDVSLAFQAEKAAAEASEDEKEVSTHLPGWGSWTGENLSKGLRKADNRQKHNPLYKTKLPGGVSRENRKDKGRENVIISEKTDRKGKKFLAPVLPHQYNNQAGGKDIYERSLRVPIGPEWSTKEVFQRNTRPRVVVKKGTVIEALEKPLV